MKYDPNIHHRRTIRLKGYDYNQNGVYFITICLQDRKCLFGKIIDDKCRGERFFAPTEAGQIAKQCWLEIPQHYPNVILNDFIIMPNHIHGILVINNDILPVHDDWAKNLSPVHDDRAKDFSPLRGPSRTIGAIVRGYKIGVTKWFRQNTDIYDAWQRNYYEHIIRNEKSMEKIREYVINNYYTWEKDILFYDQ